MKKIVLTILWTCIAGLCSCTYDYDMPDTSNTEIPPSFAGKSYEYNVRYDDEMGLYIINTINDYGYIFSEANIVITEKDENGKTLRQISKSNTNYVDGQLMESAKRAETIEVSIELVGWTEYYQKKLQIGYIHFTEIFSLDKIAGQTLILGINTPHTMNINIEFYQYDIDYSSDFYALMIKTVQSVGYDLYDFTINVIEKDKDGNILYQGEKPGKHGNLGNSQKGAKYLNIYIDLYGYHSENYPFEDEIKIATITFNETFELNEINNKILTLTPDNPYTIEFDEIEQSSYIYSISLDSSISAAINEQLINPANCRFGHYEIIVTERDADGNVLYQGEYEIHTTKQSEEGAKTLEAAIDVYGYDKDTYPFGEEKKIGSIIFTEMFNLAEIDNPFILSARDYAHRYERYY